jgi:hypothetical protein
MERRPWWKRFRQPFSIRRVILSGLSFSVEEFMGADALEVNGGAIRRGRRMGLLLAALALPLLLGACSTMSLEGKAQPADVHYYYDDIFNTYDLDMRITPAGDATVVERRGPRDSDLRRITGHLTPDQLNRLWADFAGWQNLKPFYSSDVTLLIQITYDGKMVQTSAPEKAPEAFRKAQADLDKIVRSILATTPATAPDAPANP